MASAALGGWAWWEHSERTNVEAKLSAVSRERDVFKESARENIGKMAQASGAGIKGSGPTGLTDQLNDLGISLDDDKKKKTPSEDSKLKDPGKGPGADGPAMAKLLKDPAARQALRAQADAQLEMVYAELFKELGLDDAKRDSIMAVLKNRQGAQTDLGLSVFDSGLSAADRKAAADKLAVSAKEAETKLKEMLGADYGKFERFEKSSPERQQVASLHAMLKEKNLSLDEPDAKKLTEVMFLEREAFKFDRDLSDLKTVQPDNLTEAAVDHYLEQYSKLQRLVQTKVKEILSAEQYTVFLEVQENQLHSEQTNLQWLRQLAGTGREPDARN
ncbi:MAG TPA: hypothetical protein VHM91_24940 [Verrucomicrobiales bacterium]|nr:hypothetical protein [Verrucomicrobiales bacterium]